MRYLALALVLVACGAPESTPDPVDDPVEEIPDVPECHIGIGRITLTVVAPDVMGTPQTVITCSPACPGAVVIARAPCVDGFALTLRTGSITDAPHRLVLRLQGGGRWAAGATLDGEELHGTLRYTGIFAPLEVRPLPGAMHAARFDLAHDAAAVTGAFSTRW